MTGISDAFFDHLLSLMDPYKLPVVGCSIIQKHTSIPSFDPGFSEQALISCLSPPVGDGSSNSTTAPPLPVTGVLVLGLKEYGSQNIITEVNGITTAIIE